MKYKTLYDFIKEQTYLLSDEYVKDKKREKRLKKFSRILYEPWWKKLFKRNENLGNT